MVFLIALKLPLSSERRALASANKLSDILERGRANEVDAGCCWLNKSSTAGGMIREALGEGGVRPLMALSRPTTHWKSSSSWVVMAPSSVPSPRMVEAGAGRGASAVETGMRYCTVVAVDDGAGLLREDRTVEAGETVLRSSVSDLLLLGGERS